jgi:N-methylhydantoinase A
MFAIGVDSGGTFTDSIIVADDRRIALGKALSTPARPANGVIQSITNAAEAIGLPLEDALRSAEMIAHGTTVGLNALLTGHRAQAGLLVTSGFEDTLAIARINKVVGLDPSLQQDPTRWEKPAALVPRAAIRGVRERIDAHGEIILPLDEEHAREAVRDLGAQGARAIGISLLWSFVEPCHERRLAELVREELGDDVELMLSSEIAPRLGEYERTVSVLLNA